MSSLITPVRVGARRGWPAPLLFTLPPALRAASGGATRIAESGGKREQAHNPAVRFCYDVTHIAEHAHGRTADHKQGGLMSGPNTNSPHRYQQHARPQAPQPTQQPHPGPTPVAFPTGPTAQTPAAQTPDTTPYGAPPQRSPHSPHTPVYPAPAIGTMPGAHPRAHNPFTSGTPYQTTPYRCKLVCCSLHSLVAEAGSKSHAIVVAAWFTFRRGLRGRLTPVVSYVPSACV